jgi:hypothetical protein
MPWEPDMTLREKIEEKLKKAEADYQSAAAMHSMGKVSFAGGEVKAYKEILKLL